MTRSFPSNADRVDELFALLADRQCRAALAYFRNAKTETVPVWDLACEIRDESDGGQDRVVAQLRHSTIPRLADASVVEHTPSSGLIRYHGHSELEAMLDVLEEHAEAGNGMTDS